MQGILFEKVKIGGYELKNRFLMSAAAAWRVTEEGDITGADLIHYEIAGGGVAMLIGGGVSVHASGRTSIKTALFDSDKHIPSYRIFAETIKKRGSAACFQMTHGGMWARYPQTQKDLFSFMPSFFVDGAVCEYRSEKRHDMPATPEQIYKVIAAYGDAALRAKACGYNAVEVHAAHESLLAQFLSPITNLRKDKWGGSVENRCRFHCEVLADIRKKVGHDFPVMIKLGIQDGLADGLDIEEGAAAAKIIAGAGKVNAIEVSQGLGASMTNFNDTSMKTGITSIEKEGYYRLWTKQVKNAIRETGVLVIMQGGLRSFELMEEVVQKKEADLVSMCRPYIREPMLINRWMSGDRKKAACISCNKCILRAYTEGARLECVLDKD